MTRLLASIFAADPRVDAIKSNPVHTEPYIDISILNLIFDIRYMGLMRNANCEDTAIFKINKIKSKLRSDSSEYNLSQNTNFRSLILFLCFIIFIILKSKFNIVISGKFGTSLQYLCISEVRWQRCSRHNTYMPRQEAMWIYCNGHELDFEFLWYPKTTGVSSMVASPLSQTNYTGIPSKIYHFNRQTWQ